jgi:hypothetical protein
MRSLPHDGQHGRGVGSTPTASPPAAFVATVAE